MHRFFAQLTDTVHDADRLPLVIGAGMAKGTPILFVAYVVEAGAHYIVIVGQQVVVPVKGAPVVVLADGVALVQPADVARILDLEHAGQPRFGHDGLVAGAVLLADAGHTTPVIAARSGTFRARIEGRPAVLVKAEVNVRFQGSGEPLQVALGVWKVARPKVKGYRLQAGVRLLEPLAEPHLEAIVRGRLGPDVLGVVLVVVRGRALYEFIQRHPGVDQQPAVGIIQGAVVGPGGHDQGVVNGEEVFGEFATLRRGCGAVEPPFLPRLVGVLHRKPLILLEPVQKQTPDDECFGREATGVFQPAPVHRLHDHDRGTDDAHGVEYALDVGPLNVETEFVHTAPPFPTHLPITVTGRCQPRSARMRAIAPSIICNCSWISTAAPG